MTDSGASNAPAGARVRLTRLALREFRNLARLELLPPSEGLAIVGDNGHGKTNLLEAIYYLQLLRSARGARDAELVRFGEQVFHLSAEGEIDTMPRSIAVGFDRASRRKKVRLDGRELTRLSDALGALPGVLFSPRDVGLVSGGPAERRRYLDVVLALTSRPYLNALQQYRAALLRRNAALRDLSRGRQGMDRVAVWEPALATHGAQLWSERQAWVERWGPEFTGLCAAIGEREPVDLRYATSLQAEGAVKDALEGALEAKRSLDVKRGLTHSGPHRDDLELTLGGRELRLFGSAGQQRTAALALRILEGRTLRESAGAAPILLLDDPFAELDARRSARILALLADGGLGQVFLAVPRESDIPPELTNLPRVVIEDGMLRKLNGDTTSSADRPLAVSATEDA